MGIKAVWLGQEARPVFHRCCICRSVEWMAGEARVSEASLGISKETPFNWPTAAISDGLCGAACQATYVREYCGRKA